MSIVIGGDVFPSDKNRNEFLAGDIDSLFDQEIQSIVKNADFSFCNLEGALTKHNVHIDKVMPVMKEDPSVVS
ncbi:MAG: CapA family protein, partial [Erysipelotrichaceae bacterium]|nr:CapA family protein [Erysipelotrichaceae bacterium]